MKTGSLAQMVYDDEIAASVRRLCRGSAVDEDALAIEVIGEAMNDSRNFLAEQHTVRYLRAGSSLLRIWSIARHRPRQKGATAYLAGSVLKSGKGVVIARNDGQRV